jgi:hypothetical protein
MKQRDFEKWHGETLHMLALEYVRRYEEEIIEYLKKNGLNDKQVTTISGQLVDEIKGKMING